MSTKLCQILNRRSVDQTVRQQTIRQSDGQTKSRGGRRLSFWKKNAGSYSSCQYSLSVLHIGALHAYHAEWCKRRDFNTQWRNAKFCVSTHVPCTSASPRGCCVSNGWGHAALMPNTRTPGFAPTVDSASGYQVIGVDQCVDPLQP